MHLQLSLVGDETQYRAISTMYVNVYHKDFTTFLLHIDKFELLYIYKYSVTNFEFKNVTIWVRPIQNT